MAARVAAALVVWMATVCGIAPVAAQIDLPESQRSEPITIRAARGSHWQQGAYEVWVLEGDCRIRQGAGLARSRQAVLWIDRSGSWDQGRNKVIAYLEEGVAVDVNREDSRARLTDETWLGRFHTDAEIRVHAAEVFPHTGPKPAIYQRGLARRRPISDGAVRPAQHTQPETIPAPSPGGSMPAGTRRVRVFPRSDVPVQAQWFPDRATNQWIAVIDSGVNLIVDGLAEYGSIDVSTDRLVIWTSGLEEPDLSGKKRQAEDIPLEIYMEGNIVFRQGRRVIQANRMYYDVSNRIGIVLDAELLTPAADYQGLLRLKTEVLQQTGRDRFFAENTFITSSRMGRPGYRIQTGNAYFEDNQRPAFDPWTGEPLVDPRTGEPIVEHQRLATGESNFLYIKDIPVFYWPMLATDLTDPSYYIRRLRIKNDSVYGTQVLTDWDGYQLLGIRNKPAGTDWDLSFDYLNDRGFGHGTTFSYDRDRFLGFPGRASGLLDFWGIQDDGTDNLGRLRRNLVPEKDYRYRLFGQHRQQLPGDFQLSAELGWISDRNFLEQYYEREWDELKDQTTGLELKRLHDNISWSITADTRLNKFFTQTEWLPRADHFWLGQSLFGDVFTWYEHSHAGYARLRTSSLPEDPSDLALFTYLPWERSSVTGDPLATSGERVATRQEIDWPLQLGPVKVVPYALGEFAHWGEDRSGNDLQRLYGQVGVRASFPMWKAFPEVESDLWNVHGLAHKVVFDAEFAFADANRDLDQLPLYDALDDDSIEAFRRRATFTTFGAPPVVPWPVPPQFDERYYALRTGLAGWVTSPSTEIADDLVALRLGMRHRWQTKRGMPGGRRIIDWITLDTHAVLFPDETRDNFGKTVGLVDYDFRWHVGDRLTLLSGGAFDFFPDGQRVISLGGFLNRPPRGGLYLGLHLLDGPMSSSILSLSYTYRMSPKWVSAFGMSVDLKNDGNIGQHFAVTRVGESFLVSAGVTVDASRDNIGFNLAVEPRFLPKTRLGRAGGAQIPVAGAYGLE